MDKEKLEEITKDIYLNSCFTKGTSKAIAKFIIKNNYRKPPENMVILSVDEWIDFNKNHTNELIKAKEEYGLGYEKGSKDTAEKYIKWLKEHILSLAICGNGKIRGNISITLEQLEEFSKPFGDFINYFSVEAKR